MAIDVFFERSTNTWAFFSDRLPRIEFVSQWKINNCMLIFSKVDSSAHFARTARAFHIFTANFLIIHFFFVFQIYHPSIHKFYIFMVNITIWFLSSFYWSKLTISNNDKVPYLFSLLPQHSDRLNPWKVVLLYIPNNRHSVHMIFSDNILQKLMWKSAL